MNNQLIIQFTQILKTLAGIVATLGTLVGSGTAIAPAHFGASLPPNVAATSTLPAQVGQVPFFQSFDGNNYTVASTTLGFVGSSTIQAGGVNVSNGVQGWASATSTMPATTLSPLGSVLPNGAAAASTTVTLATTTFNFSLGDPCFASIATSSGQLFITGCQITAAGTNVATATVGFTNISNATVTVGTTALVRVTAFHLPF